MRSGIVLAVAFLPACGETKLENLPPEAVGTIPDHIVFKGQREALDLTRHFMDQDGDTLAYRAAASESGVVELTVTGYTLVMIGMSLGEITVTVTATDPEGLSAQQSFKMTVPNRSPEPAGTIPDQHMRVGDTVTVSMTSYFTDPDGDELAYSAALTRPRRSWLSR